MAQLFEQLFGDVRMTGGGLGGDDLLTLELTDEEARTGVTRAVTVNRQVVCAGCAGRGSANTQVEPVACKPCGGAGQHHQTVGFMAVLATCPECRGMGRLIKEPCVTCAGHGATPTTAELTIVVPPGVTHGQTLRLEGAGGLRPDGTRYHVHAYLLVGGLPDPRFATFEPPAADLPRASIVQPTTPRMPLIGVGVVIAVLLLALVLLSR
jgi:DnaJ-class molecular chaperone